MRRALGGPIAGRACRVGFEYKVDAPRIGRARPEAFGVTQRESRTDLECRPRGPLHAGRTARVGLQDAGGDPMPSSRSLTSRWRRPVSTLRVIKVPIVGVLAAILLVLLFNPGS